MKRGFKVRRVYRLFDVRFGEPFGKAYRSKNSALRAMYRHRAFGANVILECFREYTGKWRSFECFVKSR